MLEALLTQLSLTALPTQSNRVPERLAPRQKSARRRAFGDSLSGLRVGGPPIPGIIVGGFYGTIRSDSGDTVSTQAMRGSRAAASYKRFNKTRPTVANLV